MQSDIWINNLPAEHIKGFDIRSLPKDTLRELENTILSLTDRELITSFATKKEKISKEEIFNHLWLKSDKISIDSLVVEKIKTIAKRVKEENCELRGVEIGNDSFCDAFLKSYNTLSFRNQNLDIQEDKIAYLRNMIADRFQIKKSHTNNNNNDFKRTKKIREGCNLKANEGTLLAEILGIPIRIISHEEQGIIDTITLNNGTQSTWIDLSLELEEFIFIVDLQTHFICAQKFKSQSSFYKIKEWSEIERSKNKTFKTKNIQVTYEYQSVKYQYRISALNYLKIIGLKKRMAKELYRQKKFSFDGTTRHFESWELYYKGFKLLNDDTLKDCNLKNDETLSLETEIPAPSGFVNNLSRTGGHTMTAKEFAKLYDRISKIEELVCHIAEGDTEMGTGFLIGKNKIITNYHVLNEHELKKITQQSKDCLAYFSLKHTTEKIKVKLIKVESSEKAPPDVVGKVKKKALDFSIILFQVLESSDETTLNSLVERADQFFRKKRKPYRRG